jgi:transcriptional regulator with XRE-family HTH domain
MTTNRLAIREGDRQARRQSTRLGDELHELRRRAGLTQAAIGRALGVDRTLISRLERGDPRVGIRIRFGVAAVLGADLRMTAYANSGPLIRDAAQARIVEWILAVIDRRWRRTVEAAIPGLDRRSIDLRLDGPSRTVVCEVETRVGSLEEIIRELHAKRDALRSSLGAGPRADLPIHAVLVLPRTRHHQAILREHPRTIQGPARCRCPLVGRRHPVGSSDARGGAAAPARVGSGPSGDEPLIHSAGPRPHRLEA